MLASRFKKYSFTQQQSLGKFETDGNFAFTVPSEYIIEENFHSNSLFHGGIDSPSLNAYDPLLKRSVQITKYLSLKSKATTQEYVNDLYERIILTSDLCHVNVRRILSWYIGDGCIYSVTDVLHGTLRHAIESERFSIERIRRLSLQIIQGTIYLHSKGLCPLTPWYTTNIELTRNDQIRLCSPTISTRKLNGGIVEHHHLWRHAPEHLIRLLMKNETNWNDQMADRSKEDVWSIGCIIVEMLINMILFRPQNDDPALQLFCIAQYVGGFSSSLLEKLNFDSKKIFSKIPFDPEQNRLNRLLRQIFFQFHSKNFDSNGFDLNETKLFDLLTKIFQFEPIRRISFNSIVEHPFFQMTNPKSLKKFNRKQIRKTKSSISLDELVRLCVKNNLKKSRWILTLKEICLFEMILKIEKIRSSSLFELELNRQIKIQIENLIQFLTGSNF